MTAYDIEQDGGYYSPPAPLAPMLVGEDGVAALENPATGMYPLWLRIIFGLIGIPMLVVLALLALEFVIIAPMMIQSADNVFVGLCTIGLTVAGIVLVSMYPWTLVSSAVRGYTILPLCLQRERWTSVRSGGLLLLPILLYICGVTFVYT